MNIMRTITFRSEPNFIVYSMLGSEMHTESIESALTYFEKNLEAKAIFDVKAKKTVKSREHIPCGILHTGIKFRGNIKIFKCSDTGDKITQLGEKLGSAIEKWSTFEKQNPKAERQFETYYSEN